MQYISLVFTRSKLRLIKILKRYRLFLLLVVFLLTTTLVGPVYAQAQLNIDGFYSQVQSTSAWWEKMWQTTFLSLGTSSTTAFSQTFSIMMQIVRLIAACILTIYIVTVFSVIARDGPAAFQRVQNPQ